MNWGTKWRKNICYQVEFGPMQWTQTPADSTHPACVRRMLWKGSSLSRMSVAPCSECMLQHAWLQPTNFQPTSLIPTYRWSSPWETDSSSPLHRSAGECRELNAGTRYHFRRICAKNHYWHTPHHYQISRSLSLAQMHSRSRPSVQWIFHILQTYFWERRPMCTSKNHQ